MAAVGAWLVPWAPHSCRGGVAVPWAVYGRSWGVAGALCLLEPPRGRGRSPGPRMAAVGAWTVPSAPYGRRGGVAGPLGFVSLPWGRRRSPGPRWPPWGRGCFPGPRMLAVGAWTVLSAQYGRRGCVLGPLHPVWPWWGRRRSPRPRWPPWGRGRFPGPRTVGMGAWTVLSAPYGQRRGVAGRLGTVWPPWGVDGPLGHVWPPWGRARSRRPRMAAVGAWQVRWAQCGRRGGDAGPLGPVRLPWGVVGPLGPVWPPWERGQTLCPAMNAVGCGRCPCALYGRRGGMPSPLGLVWLPWERGRSPLPRMATVGA